MKRIYFLFSISCFLLQNAHPQTIERSITQGYHTLNELIVPYGADKWLIAGRGVPAFGAYFQDTLFVMVIGNDGQIHLRKNLSIPIEEVHFFHDLLALPDGGILTSFESTLCDVGGLIISVQRLDSQGILMWEKTNGFVFGETRPPEKWFVAPDGNLLGAAYNQIWKVNTNSGDIIWKAPLEGVDGGSLNPFEFELLPGTEDFFALGNPNFQLWKKSGDPLAPIYTVEKLLDTDGYFRYLGMSTDNWFYCWQVFPDDAIMRLNLDFQLDTLPIQLIDYGKIAIAFGDEGLYLTESNPYSNRYRRFDLNGESALDLLPGQIWLSPEAISFNAGKLAVVGEDRSGNPNSNNYNSGGWLRVVDESNPLSPSLTPDAAVIGVKQNQPVDTTAVPAFIFGVWYNLQGGDFQLNIKNEGALPLHSICLNVTFGYNQFYDICPNKPSKQLCFSNLNLAPGESTWLNFGDVVAQGQMEVPEEICFWTSSPNEQPDAVHENDRFCHPVTYVVAAKEPDFGAFSFAPNPADQFADLTFQEDVQGEPWQVFDALGRQMSAGICPVGETLRLETAALPNGFYLFQVKNRVSKLLVQH
jgi:hypothetical protein